MTEQNIEYKPVREEDYDDVMALIQRTFHIDEPMNKSVGLCVDGPCKELDEYCLEALRERLSFKAVDRDGNVVGAMVSAICPMKEIHENDNPYVNMAEECKNPKFQKILYVLAIREFNSKIWEKFPNDQQYVDVKVAATHPNFRKRGIMNHLLEATENEAAQLGVGLLRMDTSSAYSAMSAERLGFTCISSTRYKDMQRDGKPILLPEAPHLEDRVYVKRINTNNA